MNKKNGQIALIITLVILVVILSIGTWLTSLIIREMKMAGNIEKSVQAFFIADSGIEFQLWWSSQPYNLPKPVNIDLGEGGFYSDITIYGIESIGIVGEVRRTIRLINSWANLYGGIGDDSIGEARVTDSLFLLVMDTTSYSVYDPGDYIQPGDFVIFEVNRNGYPEPGTIFGTKWKDYISMGGQGKGDIEKLSTGEYIITGNIDYDSKGNEDIFVMKLDSDKSTIMQQKTFSGPGNKLDNVQDAIITDADEIILVGRTTSFNADNSDDEDLIVIKLSDNLNFEKAFILDGAKDDQGIHILEIKEDTGFLLIGNTETYADGGGNDILVIKFDDDFVMEWARTFGFKDSNEEISVIVRSYDEETGVDKGYYIAGWSKNKALGFKLDKDENFEWATLCNVSDKFTFFTGAEEALTGGYFNTGGWFKTNSNPQALGLKLDDDGKLEWARSFGGEEEEFLTPIERNYTVDKGYFLAGDTESWGRGGKDGLFLKVTKGGLVYGCPDFQEISDVSCEFKSLNKSDKNLTFRELGQDEFIIQNPKFKKQDDIEVDFSKLPNCLGTGSRWMEIR